MQFYRAVRLITAIDEKTPEGPRALPLNNRLLCQNGPLAEANQDWAASNEDDLCDQKNCAQAAGLALAL